MKIEVLTCYPDGTQSMSEREVPDDYRTAPEPAPETQTE